MISYTSKRSKEMANGPEPRISIGAAKQIIGAGLLITALLVSFATGSSAITSERRIEVTAKRYAFEPADITIKAGEKVDLVLTSADVPHGLRVRELGLDLHAAKGKPAEVKFTPGRTGTFVGHCSVFCGSGHGKMILTIHVVG